MSWPWVFSTLPAGNVAASKLDDNFNAAAQLDSPAFTGTPTTTNATQAVNNSQIANTAYVDRVAVQQRVSTITGTMATGTTTVPLDNTIPQSSEGDQYMSLSITPKSASSTLKITVVGFFSSSAGGAWLMMSLFKDSETDARAVQMGGMGATGNYATAPFVLIYEMTSGSTSAMTFKVRAGAHTASTTTFNGIAGTSYMGGALASSITIEEIGV